MTVEQNAFTQKCIDAMNAQFQEKMAAGKAVFQLPAEEMEKIHAPVMVGGKSLGKDEKGHYQYEGDELKSYPFRNGTAVYLASLQAKDPRYMSARVAFGTKGVHIRAGQHAVEVVMKSKNDKLFTEKFFNFAQLSGPVIEKAGAFEPNEKQDARLQAALVELAQKKNLSDVYNASYYAFQNADRQMGQGIDSMSNQIHRAEQYNAKQEERKAEREAKKAEKDATRAAYAKACEPYQEEFQKREDAVRAFTKAVTKQSTPQEKFMHAMHEGIDKTTEEGKPLSYALVATKALYADKVPKKQIAICIEKFAPKAAFDTARKEVYGKTAGSYADFLMNRVEKSKKYQEGKQTSAAR